MITKSWQLSTPVGYNDRFGGGGTCIATCDQGHTVTLDLSSIELANRIRFVDKLPPECPTCVANQEIIDEQRRIAIADRDGIATVVGFE